MSLTPHANYSINTLLCDCDDCEQIGYCIPAANGDTGKATSCQYLMILVLQVSVYLCLTSPCHSLLQPMFLGLFASQPKANLRTVIDPLLKHTRWESRMTIWRGSVCASICCVGNWTLGWYGEPWRTIYMLSQFKSEHFLVSWIIFV